MFSSLLKRIVSYHDGQNFKVIKTLYLRYKQPRLNLKAHFTQQRLFLLVFIIKMLQPGEKILHAKMREKLR